MRKFLIGFLETLIIAIILFIVATQHISEAEFASGIHQVANRVERFFVPACSQPLAYSLGSIDPRFGLSDDDILRELASAEKIWEDASGKNLFEYNPQAELKVNFVFDGRQQQTIVSQKLENDFDTVTLLQKGISAEYDRLLDQYQKKIASYDNDVKAYEKRLKSYSKDVEYWNDHGGAPEDEYDRLRDEQKWLENEADDLNALRKEINALVKKINDLARKEQVAVDEYNRKLSTYQDKYGETSEFDKGVFSENEINIYQFEDKKDLTLVLAHEMGHALGLDHVENSASLMYYLMGAQDVDQPALTAEDMGALQNMCR